MSERAVSRVHKYLNPDYLGIQGLTDMDETGRDRLQGSRGEEYEGPIYVGSFHV